MKYAVIGGLLALYLAWKLWASFNTGAVFNPDQMVNGQRVVVTGATSGIGKSAALQYCKYGANIVVTGRREHLLKEVVDQCKAISKELKLSRKHGYIAADMQEVDKTYRVIDHAVEVLGGIDYLILNHAEMEVAPNGGIYGYQQENYDALRRNFEINFFSYVRLLSFAMPHLKKSGGKVAVMSSIYGRMPDMISNIYVATKHAMDGFFRSLDLENYFKETNVSITIIIPGFIDISRDSGKEKGTGAYLKKCQEHGFDTMKRFAEGHFAYVADVDDCAHDMIRATALRETESYFPKDDYRVWWMIYKYHLFPDWMKNIIRNYKL